jgi:PIN domain nuclease of toxin-antitoxin system
VNLLLDTCTLLWATLTPDGLSLQARQLVVDRSNTVFVSAVTAWEIATKVRLGKLPEAEKLEQRFLEVIETAGYILLSIDAEVALRAGRLVAEHRDPFDRMIAAQALSMDIPVLSPDPHFDLFGVRRVW